MWQLDQLTDRSIMGLQINYPHGDVGGSSWGLTTPSDPALFSQEWWELVEWFAAEASKRGMAISLSDYTLGSPGQGQWTDEILAEMPDLNASRLECAIEVAREGETVSADGRDFISAMAWRDDTLSVPAISLTGPDPDGRFEWTAPAGSWRVAIVRSAAKAHTIDPLDMRTGEAVISKFFERFERHLPGEAGKALNFFFSDELDFGIRGFLWHSRFPAEFHRRKGYDILPELAGLFADIGPRTPKIRLDFFDVMVSLEEESFFAPIVRWHQERGMIYGGDHGGRGYDVAEFGDYFRTQRWMNGPGNDQPRLGRDCVKTKVHSSIAHLYQQPRVWLEGYYSSGWGTRPSDLITAGVANYCLGSNLQTFHGLYYSTHGGWWEWAPPCNHFRMPYWRHIKPLMKWTERMCFLLSQGVHRCDVAVVYPVSPTHADVEGKQAVDAAFAIVSELHGRGIDCDFIDEESIQRASAENGELVVSGERYRALIIPAMSAIHFSTIEKAAQLGDSGGLVLATGLLPNCSDRIGRNDDQLVSLLATLFSTKVTQEPSQTIQGGHFVVDVSGRPDVDTIVSLIDEMGPRDFHCSRQDAHVNHRRIGEHDVYLVTNATAGDVCRFRNTGAAFLWDAFSGSTTKLPMRRIDDGRTELTIPHDAESGHLIVFEADTNDAEPTLVAGETTIELNGAWATTITPTCYNRFGDFRLPAFDGFIGPEARRLWKLAADENVESIEAVRTSSEEWHQSTYSFGQQFWKIGPLPTSHFTESVARSFAAMDTIPVAVPLRNGKAEISWEPYYFSWREGIDGDPGHQGYHGLKGSVSDDFIGLGTKSIVPHPIYKSGYPTYVSESQDDCCYALWTTISAPADMNVRIMHGDIRPAMLWIGGERIDALSELVSVKKGLHVVLAVYDKACRTHLVFQEANAESQVASRTPLSMRWYDLPGRLRFDPCPDLAGAKKWLRFDSAPGLASLRVVAHGTIEVWVGENKCASTVVDRNRDGATVYDVEIAKPVPQSCRVTISLVSPHGYAGLGGITEPIEQRCGRGTLMLGNWSVIDGMASYSGAVTYSKTLDLPNYEIGQRARIDLGSVTASAQVRVNGQEAATLVCGPWSADITNLLVKGENLIEIEVCNTLANHYQTIPTEYRGSPVSGLHGPVLVHIERTK
jgi:hypothetical protein